MKPYYNLTEEDKNIILSLIETCKRVALGNVSFEYYSLRPTTFSIKEYKTYWELTVSVGRKDNFGLYFDCRDIYKITDAINYSYSESDLA